MKSRTFIKATQSVGCHMFHVVPSSLILTTHFSTSLLEYHLFLQKPGGENLVNVLRSNVSSYCGVSLLNRISKRRTMGPKNMLTQKLEQGSTLLKAMKALMFISSIMGVNSRTFRPSYDVREVASHIQHSEHLASSMASPQNRPQFLSSLTMGGMMICNACFQHPIPKLDSHGSGQYSNTFHTFTRQLCCKDVLSLYGFEVYIFLLEVSLV